MNLSTFFSLAAHDEGLRLRAYDDETGNIIMRGSVVEGNPTIGFGINIGLNAGITKDEATFITLWRIAQIQDDLSKLPFWTLIGTARQAILVDMYYNLGKQDFYDFHKMLNALNEGDFVEAAAEIMASEAAKELPQRYTALRDMMLSGELTTSAISNPPQFTKPFADFVLNFKDLI